MTLNFLLTPVGSAGDNFPFIGLGSELARRGHRVRVATNEHFASLVRACGMQHLTVGTEQEYHDVIADPEIWHPRRGFATVMRYTAEQVRRLLEIEMAALEEDPDVILVAHSLDFAARAMADRFGTHVVAVHLQPTLMRTVYQMPVMTGSIDWSFLPRWLKRALWAMVDRFVIDPHAEPVVNTPRNRLGLAHVIHPLRTYLHSPLLTIGLWPDWFAAAQPDYPGSFVQTGFPLFDAPAADAVPNEVAHFLDAGAPPVVFTPGSANLFAHDFFAASVEASQRSGRRAMLLTRHHEHVPTDLPTGVAHFRFAPLSQVLPRCAAMVHHGGIGTTAAALAAGIPQIICPMSHDQPDNAHRVMRLGVGARLSAGQITGRRIASVMEQLLGSADVARRCADVRARCRDDDAIRRTCDLIEARVARSQQVAAAPNKAAHH